MFSEELLKGNTGVKLTTKKDEEVDKLGTILIELRDNIKNNKIEEEKRKKEDSEQNWIVEGVARFGEILRRNNDDLKTLAYEIISNMCQYVGTLQGGIFILNDNNPNDLYFELYTHFAYNRQKYSKKRIDWNEGLIGRAATERRTIILDYTPNDYLEITSGLS